uniref:BHLH domain-containing protein n=2 Tax=Chenopodium quinoa TaxID=63459 RepID=A0A803MNL7_CHEQI
MESFQYSPTPSSESLSCCTTDDQDFGGIGVDGTLDRGGFEAPKVNKGRGCNNRTGSMALNFSLLSQYHAITKRRRRDKLNQRFIALAKVIPCFDKMDKTSVLEEAIKYVKQLEERVKDLEEQAKPRMVESAMLVKRTRETVDLESKKIAFPEIEAKVSNKDVLVRIYCKKQYGLLLLERILKEMDKVHLSINGTGLLSFGNHDLDITITAK